MGSKGLSRLEVLSRQRASHKLETIIEEIALEGLDGITLQGLWLRLRTRPESFGELDDGAKVYYWDRVKVMSCIQIFELPTPRPDLRIHDRFDYIDDAGHVYEPDNLPQCIYKYVPVDDLAKGIRGSCEHYNTRVDVTSSLRAISYHHVKMYGNLIVLVASQAKRNQVLFPPDIDLENFPRSDLSILQYCILERIGRSRYLGEPTRGCVSFSKLNIDAKTQFYQRKFLMKQNMIVKQGFCIKYSGSSFTSFVTIFHLPRFYSLFETKFTQTLRKVINYLLLKPRQKEQTSVLANMFGKHTVRALTLPEYSKFFKVEVGSNIDFAPIEAGFSDDDPQKVTFKKKMSGVRGVTLLNISTTVEQIMKGLDPDDEKDEDDNYEKAICAPPSVHLHDSYTQKIGLEVLNAGARGLGTTEVGERFSLSSLDSRTSVRHMTRLEIAKGVNIPEPKGSNNTKEMKFVYYKWLDSQNQPKFTTIKNAEIDESADFHKLDSETQDEVDMDPGSVHPAVLDFRTNVDKPREIKKRRLRGNIKARVFTRITGVVDIQGDGPKGDLTALLSPYDNTHPIAGLDKLTYLERRKLLTPKKKGSKPSIQKPVMRTHDPVDIQARHRMEIQRVQRVDWSEEEDRHVMFIFISSILFIRAYDFRKIFIFNPHQIRDILHEELEQSRSKSSGAIRRRIHYLIRKGNFSGRFNHFVNIALRDETLMEHHLKRYRKINFDKIFFDIPTEALKEVYEYLTEKFHGQLPEEEDTQVDYIEQPDSGSEGEEVSESDDEIEYEIPVDKNKSKPHPPFQNPFYQKGGGQVRFTKKYVDGSEDDDEISMDERSKQHQECEEPYVPPVLILLDNDGIRELPNVSTSMSQRYPVFETIQRRGFGITTTIGPKPNWAVNAVQDPIEPLAVELWTARTCFLSMLLMGRTSEDVDLVRPLLSSLQDHVFEFTIEKLKRCGLVTMQRLGRYIVSLDQRRKLRVHLPPVWYRYLTDYIGELRGKNEINASVTFAGPAIFVFSDFSFLNYTKIKVHSQEDLIRADDNFVSSARASHARRVLKANSKKLLLFNKDSNLSVENEPKGSSSPSWSQGQKRNSTPSTIILRKRKKMEMSSKGDDDDQLDSDEEDDLEPDQPNQSTDADDPNWSRANPHPVGSSKSVANKRKLNSLDPRMRAALQEAHLIRMEVNRLSFEGIKEDNIYKVNLPTSTLAGTKQIDMDYLFYGGPRPKADLSYLENLFVKITPFGPSLKKLLDPAMGFYGNYRELYDVIDRCEEVGVSAIYLSTRFPREFLIKGLEHLQDASLIYLVGVKTRRYVSTPHIEKWTIPMFSDSDSNKEIHRIVVRPWLTCSGTINWAMVDHVFTALLGYVQTSVNIHISDLAEKVCPILSFVETTIFIEGMLHLDLIRVQTMNRPGPSTLFSDFCPIEREFENINPIIDMEDLTLEPSPLACLRYAELQEIIHPEVANKGDDDPLCIYDSFEGDSSVEDMDM